MKKHLTSALATTVAIVALASTLAMSTASAAPLTFQSLTLINGWKTYSPDIRAPKVALDAEGVVHLVGAIRDGTDAHAFTLPANFRPTKIVYVVTNLCSAAAGRLRIDPDGTVTIQYDDSFEDAQCFTSLENVTFTK